MIIRASLLLCLLLCLLVVIPARAWQSLAPPPTVQRPIQLETLARLARRVEPDLQGQPSRLTQYVDFFRKELANDTRLFAFHVVAQSNVDGEVVLEGFVEFPETRDALEGFLRQLGFLSITNRLTTLPDERLGHLRFGFLRVARSLLLAEPRADAETVSECLLAEPLFLLREADGYLLVHSSEGYLGYVPEEDVLRVDEASFAAYQQGSRAILQIDGKRESGERMPAGARFKWLESSDVSVHVQLPDGSQEQLPTNGVHREEDRTMEIDRAIQTARQLLGTPYRWGGKSSVGIDCSGLVQIAFQSTGVHLPRDSNQQVVLGRLTATRWCMSTLRRGDTLYFTGPHGRIRHTALYLGSGEYIQAETPVVTITSFDPSAENYDAERHRSFVFAKRLY
jgi:hypothetical protein